MKRAYEAEPIRPNLACSYPDTDTSLLLKKARRLLRGDNTESSASSFSVNSPLCEKIERNSTGLSSSSVSETDALPFKMTLGAHKELAKMHWIGLKEKMMMRSGSDKTGNDQTILLPATSCAVNSPFPAERDDDRHSYTRNGGFYISEALQMQEHEKWPREQTELWPSIEAELDISTWEV